MVSVKERVASQTHCISQGKETLLYIALGELEFKTLLGRSFLFLILIYNRELNANHVLLFCLATISTQKSYEKKDVDHKLSSWNYSNLKLLIINHCDFFLSLRQQSYFLQLRYTLFMHTLILMGKSKPPVLMPWLVQQLVPLSTYNDTQAVGKG